MTDGYTKIISSVGRASLADFLSHFERPQAGYLIKRSTSDTSLAAVKREPGLDAVEAVAYAAIARGSRLEAWADWPDLQRRGRSGRRRLVQWDIAGRCASPRKVELYAKQWYRRGSERKRSPMTVILDVKCRRCGWCLKVRAADWASRALNEFDEAPRTWMGTLTLSPESHALVYARTIRGITIPTKTGGVKMLRPPVPDFGALPPEVQFTELVRTIGYDLTLFIKRVRKNARTPFRYLLVAEKHKSGLPHFHILINEKMDRAPIRKTVLKDAWNLGFSKFSLVDTSGGAVYVCKYMAKDALNRVRASFKYGLQITQNQNTRYSASETKGEREKEDPEKTAARERARCPEGV